MTGQRSLRLDVDMPLYGRLRVAAARRNQSLSAMCREVLVENLDRVEHERVVFPEQPDSGGGRPASGRQRTLTRV
jgi:hypothetical protein